MKSTISTTSNQARKASSLLLIAAFFLTHITLVHAQTNPTGTVSGMVKTSDGKPAEFVNVALKGTTKGTTVNQKGNYFIKNISPGHYTLVASFIGLATQTKEIDIAAGQATKADFVLSESNSQLREVVISSGKTNKFTRQQSLDVAKLPLKNLENPQVYSVVTSELMKEQQNINISQALLNVPGAVPSTDPAGGTSITLRGFTQEVGTRNGILFETGRSGLDPVNIDHFEVLKGPSAVLYGNIVSSYGGAVNIVTKKPFDTFKGEVGYSIGNWNLSRVTLDVNTPLDSAKKLLLRTNAAVNREGSFLSTGHNNTMTFAPSLIYKASDRLTLSFDIEAYKEDLNRTPYLNFSALKLTNVNQIPLNYRSVLYNEDLNAVTATFRTYFDAKYKLSDNWYSQTAIGISNEQVDHSYQYYPTFLDATHIRRGISLFGPITQNYTNIQQNFHGDFHTGNLRHRFVWGLDYVHYNSTFTYAGATIDAIDITSASYPPATKPKADSALQAARPSLYPGQTNQYATYASDLINLTDNLMVLLSARVDRYQAYGNGGFGQTSFTPKLGLIYQPVKDKLSLFGNYMSGFTNEGPTQQPDGTVVILKPEFGRQWEAGMKLDVIHNLLFANISYYQINVSNSIRYENRNGGDYAIQDGTQKSAGWEASLTANPAPGLNLLAGYVYNKNQYTRAQTGVGKDLAGTPRNVANAWASYKFQPGTILQDFGFGIGGNYSQKSYYDLDNTIVIPSFVLINASVFYDQAKWRIGISGNNLTNKEYWSPSFTANPQPLRQVIANVTLKF